MGAGARSRRGSAGRPIGGAAPSGGAAACRGGEEHGTGRVVLGLDWLQGGKVEEEAYAQAKEKTKEDACKIQVSPSTSPILILDQPWTSPQGLVKDLFCTKNRQYLVCQKLTVFAFYV